jgi:adenylate cyclase
LAGDAGQAIQAHRRAAAFAQQSYAYREAAEHLRRALALLSTLPDDQRLQELELQLDLGLALMMVKGYADPEAQQAYNRALELCHATDANARLYEIIWGLHESYFFQGEYQKARAACEHCWRLAQQSGDPELLLQAHHAFWGVSYFAYFGQHGPQSVVEHTQQGIKLYRPEWHRTHVQRFGGHDPGVCARYIGSNALWLLGYPDQAAEQVEDAVALATRLGHPFSLLLALSQGAKVYGFRGEPQRVLDFYTRFHQLASEHHLPAHGSEERIVVGWATAQITPGKEAVALIRQGLETARQMGEKINQAYFAALLAESYIQVGDISSARHTIEQGLVTIGVTGEDFYHSELYRLQALCLLAEDDVADAQSHLQTAIRIAQQQGCKALELRAATSLSRLWAEQGKRHQAFEMLSQTYHWFTEGFDTSDLRHAKELLLALSA